MEPLNKTAPGGQSRRGPNGADLCGNSGVDTKPKTEPAASVAIVDRRGFLIGLFAGPAAAKRYMWEAKR
jgi:hypothetical protein